MPTGMTADPLPNALWPTDRPTGMTAGPLHPPSITYGGRPHGGPRPAGARPSADGRAAQPAA